MSGPAIGDVFPALVDDGWRALPFAPFRDGIEIARLYGCAVLIMWQEPVEFLTP